MADILQELTIKATPQRVFEMFATPQGLDRWWTKSSSGEPKQDAAYRLFFGPEHDWRAKVSRCVPSSAFELLLTEAHEDWAGTRVGCELAPDGDGATRVRFYPKQNEHWRVSCCVRGNGARAANTPPNNMYRTNNALTSRPDQRANGRLGGKWEVNFWFARDPGNSRVTVFVQLAAEYYWR